MEKGTVESAVWICELVAELAKDEQCRNHLLKAELFTSINKYLSEPGCTNSLRIQICRAIGNLCFENDDGRLMFLNTCGIDNLIDLLKNSGLIDFSQGDKQELVKLVVVSLGCLHNFANDNGILISIIKKEKGNFNFGYRNDKTSCVSEKHYVNT